MTLDKENAAEGISAKGGGQTGATRLQQILEAGEFSVSAEINPPMSGDACSVREKIKKLIGYADAVNVTDNPTAIVRMSSIAASHLALEEGLEPIVQMTCRDRNRIAIQSDLLGAYALGLRNVLILSGDHQSLGNHPMSKNVYDVDSVQLLKGLNDMAEKNVFMGGSALKDPVRFFLGSTVNPFADPEELQFIRLEKKIRAGARFIQTQGIFDMERFQRWIELARNRGLHEKAFLIGGVIVSRSMRSMNAVARVPGMSVPESLIRRMADGEAKGKKEETGLSIARELIDVLRTTKGVSGVHIMSVGWESAVPSIVEGAGLASPSHRRRRLSGQF